MGMKASNKQANLATAQQAQEAQEARQREAERQGRLRTGQAAIDSTFSDEAINPTIDKYKGDYMTLATSDISDKFAKAREAMTYALARSGLLSSSVSAEKTADLESQQGEGLARAQLDAGNAAAKMRSNVDADRQATVSQLYATEDPTQAANTAISRAAAIKQMTPEYNDLGDIFGGIISGIGNGYAGYKNAAAIQGGGSYSPSAPSAVAGTGSIIKR